GCFQLRARSPWNFLFGEELHSVGRRSRGCKELVRSSVNDEAEWPRQARAMHHSSLWARVVDGFLRYQVNCSELGTGFDIVALKSSTCSTCPRYRRSGRGCLWLRGPSITLGAVDSISHSLPLNPWKRTLPRTSTSRARRTIDTTSPKTTDTSR